MEWHIWTTNVFIKELGVNYFELLRQYQEHICVMKLQEGRKYELDLEKIS